MVWTTKEGRVPSDLDKNVTFGEADGPDKFIPELGIVVPTFLDPRHDLIIGTAVRRFKRVDYHVPFRMRGFFFPHDWPQEFREYLQEQGLGYEVNSKGFVLCSGINRYRERAGLPCKSRAVNRTRFCRAHGGGLHPLDKKMSAKSILPPPENRVKALDRPQKFLQGFLELSDLTDEEVQGMFIYNDAGQKVQTTVLGSKMHTQIAQELHRRMTRFLQTKTASMLQVMVDIAESDLVEPADRIKAAQWVAERTLGKTPDVIMHGKVEAPYEAIFETIDAGSREDYRKKIEKPGLELGGESNRILDAEVIEESEDSDNGEDSSRENPEWGTQNWNSDFDSSPDPGGNLESARRASNEHGEIERQKALKKARSKAKQKRFAARATGSSLNDMAWVMEWKFLGGEEGHFRLKLVCPEKQTEARLARINSVNADAEMLAKEWRENVS